MIRLLDPRARLVAVVLASIGIASTPQGAWLPYLLYLALLAPLSSLPLPTLVLAARRALRALPFLLLAALALWLRDGLFSVAAAAVLGKGLLLAWLLAILSAATPMPSLLSAMRQLCVPAAFTQILTLMLRYLSLFQEEHRRLSRARESRSPRPLGRHFLPVHARQFGELLLRAHDRAHRIHLAMCARGFHGEWPAPPLPPLAASHVFAAVLVSLAFLLARFAA